MKTDNELIAEFMGIDFTAKDAYLQYPPPICKRFGQYDKSWDWLMSVVIKCHEVGDAKEKECDANNTDDLDDPAGWRSWNYRRVALSTDINRVYSNVLLFIKWYNSQSSKPE